MWALIMSLGYLVNQILRLFSDDNDGPIWESIKWVFNLACFAVLAQAKYQKNNKYLIYCLPLLHLRICSAIFKKGEIVCDEDRVVLILNLLM